MFDYSISSLISRLLPAVQDWAFASELLFFFSQWWGYSVCMPVCVLMFLTLTLPFVNYCFFDLSVSTLFNFRFSFLSKPLFQFLIIWHITVQPPIFTEGFPIAPVLSSWQSRHLHRGIPSCHSFATPHFRGQANPKISQSKHIVFLHNHCPSSVETE